jgi:hypothetical protein
MAKAKDPLFDDNGKLEDMEATEISKGKRGRPRKSNKQEYTVEFVVAILLNFFETLAILFRSEATFSAEEMKPMAKSLLGLAERFHWVVTIFSILAPLTVVGHALKFVKRIWKERPVKTENGPVEEGLQLNGYTYTA